MPVPQEKSFFVERASCPFLTIVQDIRIVIMQAPKHYSQTVESIGEIDYNPVPPKRSERVIMRAKFKGRKKPLPYIFDEERS
ncbi:hypothetical protein QT979_14875 [Microcoleus sp. w2-18bC1]|uniref:hypothetical protein n=1 Tax=unclassified Microcoleus TaxID=2642155 RepID=UPI002FD30834